MRSATFNELREKLENRLYDELAALSYLALNTDETDVKESLITTIDVLADIRFKTDFHLIKNVKQIQDIYDNIRKAGSETGNKPIRLLMDLTIELHNQIDYENFYNRVTEYFATQLVTFNRPIALTCMDEDICDNLNKIKWLEILKQNPWLVTCLFIRNMSASKIVSMIKLFEDIESEEAK